jgi:predicted choloylglycine hydrolase
MRAQAAQPVILEGDAVARGRAQALLAPDMAEAVRAAVRDRLAAGRQQLWRPAIRRWLDAQRHFTEREAPAAFDELRGIAQGFGIAADELFAYLHLGIVADLAAADGCTAWAIARSEDGPLLVKNRDFRGEHRELQRVFCHRDPAWGGCEMLCVGSLGSPGAYSSGMNSDGLALADTQVATDDHGPGWLRYFLMTELLASCATVDEALSFIGAVAHAGGGSLVLADRTGAIAVAELGHERVAVETACTGWLARTNHFLSPALAARNLAVDGYDAMGRTSRARLETIRAALESPDGRLDAAAARRVMASHGRDGREGLCRHGQDGDARTISTSVYGAGTGQLWFSGDTPCSGAWCRYGLVTTQAPADGRPAVR